MRRELIKQEYLRRKQQELLEEQGLARPKLPKLPKTPKPKQKARPKSIFKEEPASDKCSSSMGKTSSRCLRSDPRPRGAFTVYIRGIWQTLSSKAT